MRTFLSTLLLHVQIDAGLLGKVFIFIYIHHKYWVTNMPMRSFTAAQKLNMPTNGSEDTLHPLFTFKGTTNEDKEREQT